MAYELQSGGSEDILEAVKAFKEKRKTGLSQSMTPTRRARSRLGDLMMKTKAI